MFPGKQNVVIFTLYALCFSSAGWLTGGRINLQSEKLGLYRCVEYSLGPEILRQIRELQTNDDAFKVWKDCFPKHHIKHPKKKYLSKEELYVILYLCAVGTMELVDKGLHNFELVSVIYDRLRCFSITKNEKKLTKKQRGLYFWILRKLAPYTASILNDKFAKKRPKSDSEKEYPYSTSNIPEISKNCPDSYRPRTHSLGE